MNYYFAYGSNLHPVRLEDRLGPAEVHSTGRLKASTVRFNKTGGDGSGKASIYEVEDQTRYVYGVIYRISDEQERLLDGFESLGKGYDKIEVEIILENNTQLKCLTYQGMPEYVDDKSLPFEWYKKIVVLGAEFWAFPDEYIRELRKTPSVSDSNQKRVKLNSLLIEKMRRQQNNEYY